MIKADTVHLPEREDTLRVIRYHLGNVLEVGSPQGRFITQGVTLVECGLCEV